MTFKFFDKSIKVVLNEKLNHLNDLKSIYNTLNKESNESMPESIKNKMDNLLKKWTKLETKSDDNLLGKTLVSVDTTDLKTPVSQSPELKSPLNETNANQTELTITTMKTTTVLSDILTDESDQSELVLLKKSISCDQTNSSQVANELKREESENFDDFFTKEAQDSQQSKLVSSVNDDINTDDIKKSSSFIQDSSFNAVLSIEPSAAPDDIEIISNDLFDWLLWIDHTLESQVV